MGRDTDRLNIISMNSLGRKGSHYQSFRKPIWEQVIGDAEPDILFLPGDQPDMKSTILSEYKQANVTHNNDTVLLYDTKRLRLKSPGASGLLPSLVIPEVDNNKMAYPLVDILAPKPTQHVVKKFQIVTWHYELTRATSEELYRFALRYVWLAQYLAFVSGVEVLIAGDFNLPLGTANDLVKQHNKLIQGDINNVKPFFREMGYLDEMTDNVLRPERRLRQLELHECEAKPNISDPEYFVASKEMQLCKTETLENFQQSVRRASISICNAQCPVEQSYCPTKTQMCIPSRPPRQNGG